MKGKFENKRHFSLLTDSQVLTDIDNFFMVISETSPCAISEFWRCLSYLIENS